MVTLGSSQANQFQWQILIATILFVCFQVLGYFDYFFTIVFGLEVILKVSEFP